MHADFQEHFDKYGGGERLCERKGRRESRGGR